MNQIKAEECDDIENSIKLYMIFFRKNFPSQVFPKLYFLEDHVLNFIRKYGLGMSLFGEQGCESVHRQFNRLEHLMWHIPNAQTRLLNMMSEHLVSVHPEIQEAIVKPKKRKLECK